MKKFAHIVPLAAARNKDLAVVGGKNASLGELIGELAAAGVRVPDGFATTADAYRAFLRAADLRDLIDRKLESADIDSPDDLARAAAAIRDGILAASLPADLDSEIRAAYRLLDDGAGGECAVAVRSSATAEDLPEASFAGQQDTFLNVRGEDDLVAAVKRVFASLYTARAIAYRAHHGFDSSQVAISVGVQKMARSDLAASGVMFTLDTESGFENAVFITAAYGLGELVVQGAVNPDEFYVYKPALEAGRRAIIRRRLGEKAAKMIFADSAAEPVTKVDVEESMRRRFCISDEEAEALARHACAIEKHYGRPMDIEWAKDGRDGALYILQARPETAHAKKRAAAVITRYRLTGEPPPAIAEGRAIGRKIGIGPARPIKTPDEMGKIKNGDVLIADMTDPDWEPVMKKSAAILTKRGGRTCHAAIIARELGIPAVVGCGNSLDAIAESKTVTVSCAQGDTGAVFAGAADFAIEEIAAANLPPLAAKLQINVANPGLAFEFSRLPADGVGLARIEFVIAREIGFHPRCATDYARLPPEIARAVRRLSAGFETPRECYVRKLAEGVATLAAAFDPRPVIVRLSDFKSNEYASMVGGRQFEPVEENPMLGFRGASRYRSPEFSQCFALECEAVKIARNEIGLKNILLMAPFVRTLADAEGVIEALAANGLRRGEDGLKIVMMCEVPANAILAEDFLRHFDGFSIGSNDLTQLTLALDRDSGLVADLFDERDPAVKQLVSRAIRACRAAGKYVGICGQAPSDHPDFAEWLLAEGVSAISLNPDALLPTWRLLAKHGEK